jgi:probable HAF family extracellular repeat protein
MKRTHLVILISLLIAGTFHTSSGGTFVPLGYLYDEIKQSRAYDVSADGKVVVGTSVVDGTVDGTIIITTEIEAFRWTEETGMVSLGSYADGDVWASAVSGDGSVIVGVTRNRTTYESEAFRWSSETGMVGLGDFDGGNFGSSASGISDDGLVVVGKGSPPNQSIGFNWTSETGLVSIGDLPGGVVQSWAIDASADGSVVVGSSFTASAVVPFRWTSDGMVGLDLGDGFIGGEAKKVTPDGSVIIGDATLADYSTEAFRWTAATGMVGLGALSDEAYRNSQAHDVTADGKTVVGESTSPSLYIDREAFIWDEAGGMRSLKEELETVHGIDLEGWQLNVATGISDDGSVIVGQGLSPTFVSEAWMVQITPVVVTVQPTTTLEFSGPLILKDDTSGTATYSGVDIDDLMGGRFTIGQTDDAASFSGPDTYLFAGSSYFGILIGNGIETSTEGAYDPLEVRFNDNTAPAAEDLGLINTILGTNLPVGTELDVAEIETRVTDGNRVIEFGVSFISQDLSLLDGSDYRPFPTLEEVDAAVYFVVESVDDVEVFNAIGRISEFFSAVTDITVVATRYAGDTFEIDFVSSPGVTGWQVRAGSNPGGDFPDDLSALPTTMITESAVNPGTYTVVIDISGLDAATFIRIER